MPARPALAPRRPLLLPDQPGPHHGCRALTGATEAPQWGGAPIEDYALIGDCRTGALVSRAGSIDWLCWPRFDSPACLAALVGTRDHGFWRISPKDPAPRITRAYRDGSIVLETVFATADGEAAIVDFMPTSARRSCVIRLVTGRTGVVAMDMQLALRFGYGASIPWVSRLKTGDGICAVAGPDMVTLRAPVDLRGRGFTTEASFTVAAGQTIPFTLTYAPSHTHPAGPIDPHGALAETERFWSKWSARGTYRGPHAAAVSRSLVTLKALTHHATGGIVAAPTTSLPEQLGGTRNWDYRYCWLRDASITLIAFMECGYFAEAQAWRAWLHRSVAGTPDQLQIMYGVAGERRLREWQADWLPGYQGASPVRIRNAAHDQLQLDTYGETMSALYVARQGGLAAPEESWSLETHLVEHLERIWREPDEGIWETRGGRRHFTFSKVMAWAALDRSIRSAEAFQLDGPLDRWRAVRTAIHDEVCAHGFDSTRNTFTQSFGDPALDASTLLIPRVGFLPIDDPRVSGTIAAIERELMVDGFVKRYATETGSDGLPPGEGVFLACSFWLAEMRARQGRHAEARALFDRLLSLRNDVGLLSEEYDPHTKRLVGNFPQAFSHVALIGAALELDR